MSEGKRLPGRVAFITGGASGIGRGIAERFISEGAKVVLFDRNGPLLQEVSLILKDDCLAVEGDVAVEKDLENAIAEGVKKFGRIDIGINSAGVGTWAYISEQAEEQWDMVIDIDLKGVFLSMKHESRQMLSQGEGGVIVNIASLNSRQPAEGMSAYCSAKAGVEMMTKVAAMELGPHKIRVCAISPGGTDTPMTAGLKDFPDFFEAETDNVLLVRKMGTTDDMASAALFLVSDEASWITAETLFVDGGMQTKRYPFMPKYIPMLQMLMSKGKEHK
jgi:NAD(P)-dependent dehydrogenase (short-subunit alcohol dehydrogenase family)